MAFPVSEIEARIGYTFRNAALLQEAFTHSTYANRYGGANNERLEYLGDSVLQLIVSERLYALMPTAAEGELTQERQQVVCEDALDKATRALGIERYLLAEGGKSNIGKKTVSSLFEALTAAIYLDGGYDAAKRFVERHGASEKSDETTNYKGMLQEVLQKDGQEPPVYTVSQSGKSNAPQFLAATTANGFTATGFGKTKREAEQAAAKSLLEKLGKNK